MKLNTELTKDWHAVCWLPVFGLSPLTVPLCSVAINSRTKPLYPLVRHQRLIVEAVEETVVPEHVALFSAGGYSFLQEGCDHTHQLVVCHYQLVPYYHHTLNLATKPWVAILEDLPSSRHATTLRSGHVIVVMLYRSTCTIFFQN